MSSHQQLRTVVADDKTTDTGERAAAATTGEGTTWDPVQDALRLRRLDTLTTAATKISSADDWDPYGDAQKPLNTRTTTAKSSTQADNSGDSDIDIKQKVSVSYPEGFVLSWKKCGARI